MTEHFRKTTGLADDWLQWTYEQIRGMIEEHSRSVSDVDERDLLRASGALELLGIKLGMYRCKGIDCPDGYFKADGFPEYHCPIEVEEYSSGFRAAHHAVHRKQRVVLLCMEHDAKELLRGYVDVLELQELGKFLKETA